MPDRHGTFSRGVQGHRGLSWGDGDAVSQRGRWPHACALPPEPTNCTLHACLPPQLGGVRAWAPRSLALNVRSLEVLAVLTPPGSEAVTDSPSSAAAVSDGHGPRAAVCPWATPPQRERERTSPRSCRDQMERGSRRRGRVAPSRFIIRCVLCVLKIMQVRMTMAEIRKLSAIKLH